MTATFFAFAPTVTVKGKSRIKGFFENGGLVSTMNMPKTGSIERKGSICFT